MVHDLIGCGKWCAASNSFGGFCSFFPEIFGGCERRYIIKGGPGTGKSTLMRAAADAAVKRGLRCECFFCSSDPSSLDGLIIYDESGGTTAIIDGTPPHTADAVLPGAKDEILNLGQFWNSAALRGQREEIGALGERKSALYVSACHYLSAAGAVTKEYERITGAAFAEEKAEAACKRLVGKLLSLPRKTPPPGTPGDCLRLYEGIGMDGFFAFPLCSSDYPTRFIISDRRRTGHRLTEKICRMLREEEKVKEPLVRVPDPFFPDRLSALLLPARGAAVLTGRSIDGQVLYPVGDGGTVINTERFFDRSKEAGSDAAKLRFCRRSADSLLRGAAEVFSEIRKVHFTLEGIYGAAMDFPALDRFREDFLKNLF